ncbi:MAG TPA: Hsp20/alpha crystallin family protein, partial [Streptosporangiaceae bacterium]
VDLDLPGLDPDKDVQVTVQDGVLCISGERHTPEGAGYYPRAWRYGRFERGFALPGGVTGDGITASYRNGVLEVVVPKAAPHNAEPRHIPVTSNGGKTLAAGAADPAFGESRSPGASARGLDDADADGGEHGVE